MHPPRTPPPADPAALAEVRRFLRDRVRNDLTVVTLLCTHIAELPAEERGAAVRDVLAAADRIAGTVDALSPDALRAWRERYAHLPSDAGAP